MRWRWRWRWQRLRWRWRWRWRWQRLRWRRWRQHLRGRLWRGAVWRWRGAVWRRHAHSARLLAPQRGTAFGVAARRGGGARASLAVAVVLATHYLPLTTYFSRLLLYLLGARARGTVAVVLTTHYSLLTTHYYLLGACARGTEGSRARGWEPRALLQGGCARGP